MKTIITGAFQATEEDIYILRDFGLDLTLHQDERHPVEDPEKYEMAICNGLFLYNDIEKFKKLKYIQLTSAGMERVPLEYIRSNGIKIYNARGVYSIPMAEFAVCGVLQLYKQSRFFAESQRQHKWEKHRGLLELYGKTVCIVGCGSVGTECAKRFSAFGCQVIGVDVVARTGSEYAKIRPLGDLTQSLSESDIVVLTLSLTDETYHLINRKALDAMKAGAVLVNIARGAVLDTTALMDVLQTHLGGAVLDVFEEEPISESSPLYEMENVILTPHNSFVGEKNHERMMNIICTNLQNYYRK